MANVLPLDVKLMDLLQVLSARYPTDADIGDAYQLAGQLSCSEESLAAWKREHMAIEAEWDVQAVAKLCDVPLLHSIRPAIEPTLIALKKRVAELEAAIEAMRVSGGSAEFQLAYDRALELLKGGAQ